MVQPEKSLQKISQGSSIEMNCFRPQEKLKRYDDTALTIRFVRFSTLDVVPESNPTGAALAAHALVRAEEKADNEPPQTDDGREEECGTGGASCSRVPGMRTAAHNLQKEQHYLRR